LKQATRGQGKLSVRLPKTRFVKKPVCFPSRRDTGKPQFFRKPVPVRGAAPVQRGSWPAGWQPLRFPAN
jgi:hypothetical protein